MQIFGRSVPGPGISSMLVQALAMKDRKIAVPMSEISFISISLRWQCFAAREDMPIAGARNQFGRELSAIGHSRNAMSPCRNETALLLTTLKGDHINVSDYGI